MKTRIIESVAEPVAPVGRYPQLVEHASTDHRFVVLATNERAGVVIASSMPAAIPVGYVYSDSSSTWVNSGYKPLTRPITIEFTP
jgi:hypothetical protein